MCVKKYFQKVQSLLRSWRLALQDTPLNNSMLKCMVKTDSKFPIDAGFLCSETPVTAAMLKDTPKRPLHEQVAATCTEHLRKEQRRDFKRHHNSLENHVTSVLLI
jgi:hypothetical protein